MSRSDAPLDRVARRLWMGSRPDPESSYSGFDVLVLSAWEYQPRGVFRVPEIIHVPLDDSGSPPTAEEVEGALVASREVARHRRAGRRVLVTCTAGMNRSGLIVALALRRLGVPAASAIALVRRARGDEALSNPWFAELVRTADLRVGAQAQRP